MNQVNLDDLGQIEVQLLALLRKRGLAVEHIHAIGLIGRGASSSVFSLLLNHEYHVLKLYYSHYSYLREQRNRRRLIWPPRIVLASSYRENPLGYDLVITKVPKGESFNSDHLQEWVQDRLGQHLIELHRLRRARRVSSSSLMQSLTDTEIGAYKAAELYGLTGHDIMADLFREMRAFLKASGQMMRVQSSILHNDVWWDNIIVAQDEVYLIDWESMRLGDYAEDLAFARVMVDYFPAQYQSKRFWRAPRNAQAVDRFWCGIAENYVREFNDDTLHQRLKFYLALKTLHRLGDMVFSNLPLNHEILTILMEELPTFWRDGLESQN